MAKDKESRKMKQGNVVSTLLVALCTTLPAAAEDAADDRQKVHVGTSLSSSKTKANSNSWSVSARGNQAERNQQQGVEPGLSELTLTVYDRRGRRDGDKAFGPVYDRRGERTELDVTTELETCADGNTRVNALRIGTWRYKMDGSCEDFRRGGQISVSLDGGNTVITTRSNVKKTQEDSAQIRCDAATWTCRTE